MGASKAVDKPLQSRPTPSYSFSTKSPAAFGSPSSTKATEARIAVKIFWG